MLLCFSFDTFLNLLLYLFIGFSRTCASHAFISSTLDCFLRMSNFFVKYTRHSNSCKTKVTFLHFHFSYTWLKNTTFFNDFFCIFLVRFTFFGLKLRAWENCLLALFNANISIHKEQVIITKEADRNTHLWTHTLQV